MILLNENKFEDFYVTPGRNTSPLNLDTSPLSSPLHLDTVEYYVHLNDGSWKCIFRVRYTFVVYVYSSFYAEHILVVDSSWDRVRLSELISL
jgi:hypothetical protein